VSDLRLVPVSFARAAAFVAEHHRHHAAPRGHKFSIGIAEGDELVGVAMVGRPVARAYDNGLTLEVNRTAVADDIPNGNSMLYGAAWRAAKALGYLRLVTYTQAGPWLLNAPLGRAGICRPVPAALRAQRTCSGHFGRRRERA
jgi:hypothetical protein